MQLSYATYRLLLDLHDPEAERVRDCMWDLEWSASRRSEGRLYFAFFTQSGSLGMEAHTRG